MHCLRSVLLLLFILLGLTPASWGCAICAPAEPGGTLRQRLRAADVVVLAALENVTNQQYIGSVIINQAGRQYFEPGLPRNWRVGVQAVVPF